MAREIDPILSAIQNGTGESPEIRAIANYLGLDLPKRGAETAGRQDQGAATERAFMSALAPIIEAMQLDPRNSDDEKRIHHAHQLVQNLEGILSGTNTNHYGIALPAVTNRHEIGAVADFIHKIWQDTNSYRTRYKDMKIDGKPVTDKTRYLSDLEIPVEYHDYYKLTRNDKFPDGILQEDIKRIPNTLLSPNNSTENFIGAQSYIEQLGILIDKIKSGMSDGDDALLDCLRKIHLDWYERNSSWTVPYGEPATFDAAPIETRYNGARQLFEIAGRFRVLEIPEIAAAFHKLMEQLKEEKFAPYAELSVTEAYSAMAHKTGFRPTILGDAHVAEFFASRFSSIPCKLTPGSSEKTEVAEFLKRYIPDIKGISADKFEIQAPKVEPGSGARVYIINNKDAPEGDKTLAVLKIHRNTHGLDEIVSNIAAYHEVQVSPNFCPVGWLSMGLLDGGDYFVLLDAAKKFEAETVFCKRFGDRMSMVSKAADALATLHGPTLEPDKYRGGDLTTFKGNCWYDVRELSRYLAKKPGAPSSPYSTNNPLADVQRDALAIQIQESIDNYSEIVERTPALLCPSEVHGDMHGGNLFIADDSDLSMLIDYGGITWTLGQSFGTGDRGNDLGRFIGSIFAESIRRNFDIERDTRVLVQSLITKYLAGVKISPDSEQGKALLVSAAFYANRFIAVTAQDTDARKYKPVGDESLAQLRQRLFEGWTRLPELFDLKSSSE